VLALHEEVAALKEELAAVKVAAARQEGAREQMGQEVTVLRGEAKEMSHKYQKKLKGLERANLTLVDSLRQAKDLLVGLPLLRFRRQSVGFRVRV